MMKGCFWGSVIRAPAALLMMLLILLRGSFALAEEADITPVSVDELLVAIVIAPTVQHIQTLRNALVALPKKTELFVTTAIEAGYTDEVIMEQCLYPLEESQVPALITLLIEQGADVELVFRTCLPAVRPEEMVNLITSILLNTDPTEIDSTIQLAMEILGEEGQDSRTILVESLVSGGLIEVDDVDCVGDCLRPLAEDLIERLSNEFTFDTDTGQTDEPALSES